MMETYSLRLYQQQVNYYYHLVFLYLLLAASWYIK